MRRYRSIFFLISLLSVVGCATTDDLRRVHGDLARQIQVTNEKIVSVEQGWAPLKDDLKNEIEGLRKEIAKTNEAIPRLRGNQAEGRAEITEIRERLQQIRGTIDGLRKELSTASLRTTKREEEEKILREKLDNLDKLTFRINFIENFLGIGKKDEPAESPAEKAGKKAPAAKDAAGIGKTDKESLYAAAYGFFKEGKYEKARESFENFLKQYPDTEFSDNAQFWVGECYYFEKKYEKAIVEYDKVTKNFPEGNKVPYALLKQGISFLKLGDKASAKLLLQQVTKDFPNTSQARIARAKLLEIK
ncbi:MAG: tol-pal system protein YbgF [Proteobacteria bacterium]|nr:tol-pal system protein YbgF [Pseudomonadota bacterium]